MPNQTFMQFVSNTGTYIFDQETMPLISRRLEAVRPTDQGQSGYRRINCSLTGFIQGGNHKEVVAAYQLLLNVIKANDARFIYKTDNITTVLDEQVYIDGYDEPSDWKQYTGDYSITFHYFQPIDNVAGGLGITARYVPSSGTPFVFDPVPLWSASWKPNREDFRSPRITPSGQPIADETQVTLTGQLAANNYIDLKAKADALDAALRYDGTLFYGTWTNPVRIESFSIPDTFPKNHCDYQIVFKYDSPGIIRFEATREFDRLHGSPKITELPFCGTVRTQVFMPLGQYVNYFFSLRAMTVGQARSLLANEVANMIISGGIEISGGKEIWDYTRPSVTLSCTKYYYPPVLNNMAGS